MWPFIGSSKKASLGVDIGAKGIRIVELSKIKDRVNLENYGELRLDASEKDSFKYFDKRTLLPFSKNVSLAVKAIIEEAQINSRRAVFSLPDFATFFTDFKIPAMSEKELPQAVEFEARKHIPLPFNEVVLDWELISPSPVTEGDNRVLIMAVSKSLVNEYKKIAVEAGLELVSLEAEVLGLRRVLLKNNKNTVCLVEIGYQSTTVSISDGGFIKTSFSFDIAGKDLTYGIAEAFNVDMGQAEDIKKREGLVGEKSRSVLVPTINLIFGKIRQVVESFEKGEGKTLQEIVLSGGSVLMPGLLRAFEQEFNSEKKIRIGTPFSEIIYPEKLEPIIKEISPNFSIAIGEALKLFE